MAINSVIFFIVILLQESIFLPFNPDARRDLSGMQLTEIGQFGLKRKARPNVPAHYHTGIDIKRSGNNYDSEPVFPIEVGRVISRRTDGPYANIIIEHTIKGVKIWTLYEHIAGIQVKVGDVVKPTIPIARFMNKDELNRHGWQFDHFHFEIIRVRPMKIEPTVKNPERFFNSYSLICYSLDDLQRYYFDPMEFLKSNLQ